LVNHQSNQPRQTNNMHWGHWLLIGVTFATFLLAVWALFSTLRERRQLISGKKNSE